MAKKISTDASVQLFEDFDFGNLPTRMSRCRRGSRGACVPTSADDVVFGVKSLSEQIRSMRNGGLPLGSRELTDANYDEDDCDDIDPTFEPGFDRFEKSEALRDRISDRMKKRYEERLKQAKTE
jgi:hypothetical protein